MALVEAAASLVPEGTRVFQLLCGRDIARDMRTNVVHRFAVQMANYVYVVESQGKAVVVDPAWDVEGVLAFCKTRSVELVAAVFTHRHFDHTGGRVPASMTGGSKAIELPGIADFARAGVPVMTGARDLDVIAKQSGLNRADIRGLSEGDTIQVGGETLLRVLETPGHTPGSVSFALGCAGAEDVVLFTGDTLFIGSCGRVDLPESDAQAMLSSLARLGALGSKSVVLPGHNYAMPAHSTIGEEAATNAMMLQALRRHGKGQAPGTIEPEPVAALLPLPDYLGVARRLFADASPPAMPEARNLESHF